MQVLARVLMAGCVGAVLTPVCGAVIADELLGGPVPGYRTYSPFPACGRELSRRRHGADYVAGVNAYGEPVVPADSLASLDALPGPVVAFDIPVPRGALPPRLHGDATAGTVTVDTADGAVSLDGWTLGHGRGSGIERRCGMR